MPMTLNAIGDCCHLCHTMKITMIFDVCELVVGVAKKSPKNAKPICKK